MLKVPHRVKVILVSFSFLVVPALLHAQPADPNVDPDVPIAGIEILLGLGGLWGAKKIMDMKKRKS
jgi:hypothetical protein